MPKCKDCKNLNGLNECEEDMMLLDWDINKDSFCSEYEEANKRNNTIKNGEKENEKQ